MRESLCVMGGLLSCFYLAGSGFAEDEDPFGPEEQSDIQLYSLHDYDNNAFLLIASDQTFFYRSHEVATSGRWLAQENDESVHLVLIDEKGRLGAAVELHLKSPGLVGDLHGPKEFVNTKLPMPANAVDELGKMNGYRLIRDDVEILFGLAMFCLGDDLSPHYHNVLRSACFDDFKKGPLETLRAIQACRNTLLAMVSNRFNQNEVVEIKEFMVHKIRNGTFFSKDTPELAGALNHVIVRAQQEKTARENKVRVPPEAPKGVDPPEPVVEASETKEEVWNKMRFDTLRELLKGFDSHTSQETLDLLKSLNKREEWILSVEGKLFSLFAHIHASNADPNLQWTQRGQIKDRKLAIQEMNMILQAMQQAHGRNSRAHFQALVEQHRQNLVLLLDADSNGINSEDVLYPPRLGRLPFEIPIEDPYFNGWFQDYQGRRYQIVEGEKHYIDIP